MKVFGLIVWIFGIIMVVFIPIFLLWYGVTHNMYSELGGTILFWMIISVLFITSGGSMMNRP